MEQELQILVAARVQEVDHLLVVFDRGDNFVNGQSPAAVLIDEFEAPLRRIEELGLERDDFAVGGLLLPFPDGLLGHGLADVALVDLDVGDLDLGLVDDVFAEARGF